ncbi:unnamed protein product [Vicia faba]|uniref:Late embryogenesis abundant protein LEA-2 subgroup domain-containing protein n=1 Tax=Vicia faba TaxID=3906 RepID=A0AAV1AWM8_VICFA|nr:unnamed protein product [Vicia faba]
MASVEPQNERNHVRFSTLPQSETEVNHHEQQPLSISRNTRRIPTISDNNYSEEICSISPYTCDKIQNLLGVTMLMLLIFLPLYRRSGTPKQDPIPPIFNLNSIYISNFTIGTKGLAATWDAKFTITNINVSAIHFRSIDFTIFYKQNPEDALSVASSDPFNLFQGEFKKLHLKFMTMETADWEANQQQPFVESNLVEEIGKDRAKNNGTLSFGIQMKVQASYYGDYFAETLISDVVMTPYCDDLVVHFFPRENSGRLVTPNRNFLVPIHWKPVPFS